MSTSQLQHNWTPHNCGIEVNSFNLTSTTPQDISLIKSALAVHGCVYFRNSPLTPAQHHNFASSFSTININRFFPSLHEEGIEDGSIALVEKKKEAGSAVGERFHTDHSYDVAPALGSILVARELPQTGGDTVFVDMQKGECVQFDVMGITLVIYFSFSILFFFLLTILYQKVTKR
jgi:taurine dioxygenase